MELQLEHWIRSRASQKGQFLEANIQVYLCCTNSTLNKPTSSGQEPLKSFWSRSASANYFTTAA